MFLRTLLFFAVISSSYSLRNPEDPARCGFAGVPAHGSKDSYLRHVGATVRYKCQTGYRLIGARERTCLDTQIWSGVVPECQPVSCGAPPNPSNSRHVQLVGNPNNDSQENSFGAEVMYHCEEGFRSQGSHTLKCGANAKWNGVIPHCVRVACPKHDAPQNGIMIGQDMHYNSYIKFKCNTGYIMQGTPVRRCRKDGNWNGVEPRCIACAKVDGKVWVRRPKLQFQLGTFKSKNGNSAKVRVPNKNRPLGYSEEWIKLLGRGTQHYALVADNRAYIDEIFVGTKVLAGQFGSSTLHMGTVTNITEEDDIMNYEVEVKGEKQIYSLDQLRTLDPPRFCVTCGDPGTPTGGYKNKELTKYMPGMQVVYTCGYTSKLIGHRTITCLINGEWSESPPSCKAFRCDYLDVKPPSNGKRIGKDFSVGASVEFLCDNSLILVGEQKVTCMKNGSWSAPPPICKGEEEIKCEQLECEFWEKCNLDQETAEARCTCRSAMECSPLYKPVCGNHSGILDTYNNLCIMKAKACRENTQIHLVADGHCQETKVSVKKEEECPPCQMQENLKLACLKPIAALIGKVKRVLPADNTNRFPRFEIEIKNELPQGTRKTPKRITLAVEDKQGLGCMCPIIPIKEKFLLLSNELSKLGRSYYQVRGENTFVKAWDSQLKKQFKKTCEE